MSKFEAMKRRSLAVGAMCACWGTAHAIYGYGSLDATGFNDVGMISGASGEVVGSNWVMTAMPVEEDAWM